MRADSIDITTAIVHIACICACCIGTCTIDHITSLACAFDCVCGSIMGTVCIGITTTVLDQATVCKGGRSKGISSTIARECGLVKANIPVQVTFESEPVFVYPILQVQTTPKLLLSCEQTALVSQSPFFTSQLSRNSEQTESVDPFQS